MIQGLFDGGAMPVLERSAQFAAERHQVLAHNIANLSTPYFKATDLDPESFQTSLRDAIDQRRRTVRPNRGPLPMKDSRELEFKSGGIDAKPTVQNDNILFHDRNNRDLERTMAKLAENTMHFTMSMDMLRNQFQMLETAIRERV